MKYSLESITHGEQNQNPVQSKDSGKDVRAVNTELEKERAVCLYRREGMAEFDLKKLEHYTL